MLGKGDDEVAEEGLRESLLGHQRWLNVYRSYAPSICAVQEVLLQFDETRLL